MNERELLTRAMGEIRVLRHQVEILSAKVETMDAMVMLVEAVPRSSPMKGHIEDLSWAIEKHLEETKPRVPASGAGAAPGPLPWERRPGEREDTIVNPIAKAEPAEPRKKPVEGDPDF